MTDDVIIQKSGPAKPPKRFNFYLVDKIIIKDCPDAVPGRKVNLEWNSDTQSLFRRKSILLAEDEPWPFDDLPDGFFAQNARTLPLPPTLADMTRTEKVEIISGTIIEGKPGRGFLGDVVEVSASIANQLVMQGRAKRV